MEFHCVIKKKSSSPPSIPPGFYIYIHIFTSVPLLSENMQVKWEEKPQRMKISRRRRYLFKEKRENSCRTNSQRLIFFCRRKICIYKHQKKKKKERETGAEAASLHWASWTFSAREILWPPPGSYGNRQRRAKCGIVITHQTPSMGRSIKGGALGLGGWRGGGVCGSAGLCRGGLQLSAAPLNSI